MKDLKRILATAMTLCLLSAGVLAFDQKKDNPPPKQEKEVPKVEKKDPPRNDGGSKGGGEGKKGKPG